MKPESKLLILLLFLSPAMGELLSGSAPPQQFFNPIMLFTFIQLTLYHATMSTQIPIAIVDLAWPRYRNVPLLKKRGLVLVSAGGLEEEGVWRG